MIELPKDFKNYTKYNDLTVSKSLSSSTRCRNTVCGKRLVKGSTCLVDNLHSNRMVRKISLCPECGKQYLIDYDDIFYNRCSKARKLQRNNFRLMREIDREIDEK